MTKQTRTTDTARHQTIFDSMMTRLGKRDVCTVSIIDLYLQEDQGPHPREVVAALRWAAAEYAQQVETLRNMAAREKSPVLPAFAKASAQQLAAAERCHAMATAALDMLRGYTDLIARIAA